MNDRSKEIFSKLEENIQSIVKVYRVLLEVVRKEKEILISSDIDALNENNIAKEKLLVQVSRYEKERSLLVQDMAEALNMKVAEPKMLDLAKEVDFATGDRIRNLHSVLVLLLKRVKETNEQNEVLVQSALKSVQGAMNSIKENLVDQTTYKEKGKIEKQATLKGRLVSREV
ncbi:MAG: hypothetical protein CL677_10115 [Bdellovibrionaceae bacterium]|nr:hypothetical protein [Pseudobdellovibrionaceae bacterium]|tara:strand:+ start:50052 stop:50567 length:516 start_codon:yes stop_codon:yes gene_type:complete